MDRKFDIVACDFNFSDDILDGYSLLTWLINTANHGRKSKIRKAKFLFYSGTTDKLEKVAGSDVKQLLGLKIEKIVDREHLAEAILTIVKKLQKDIDIISEFTTLFDEHSNKVFKSVYPQFKGYTLEQVREEIEKESDHGNLFIKALVEQTFSHMIKLQDD